MFLACKTFTEEDRADEEFLYLTKNMIVHNASNPFVIHHETHFIEKVVNARHKLLITMGKDRTLDENMENSQVAYFIKIWDFMSLVEGTSKGCKFLDTLLLLMKEKMLIAYSLFLKQICCSCRPIKPVIRLERRHYLGKTSPTRTIA